jgi:uncharacterized protein YcbK (DUF882 family)
MLGGAAFFKPSELACKDGTPYPPAWGERHHRLVILTADPIRRMWGGPLVVVSCYRTPEYNDALEKAGHHVASSSQHVTGNAVDLQPRAVAGMDTVLDLHDMVLRAHAVGQLPELGGLGLYDGWIHVDTHKAADGHLRRWNMRA